MSPTAADKAAEPEAPTPGDEVGSAPPGPDDETGRETPHAGDEVGGVGHGVRREASGADGMGAVITPSSPAAVRTTAEPRAGGRREPIIRAATLKALRVALS
jgi:hypothetical protein